MPWNPDRYHQFQAERSAPFYDLLKLINIRPNLRVADLGCGTGELTRRLAEALPNSNVFGLELSAEMLEKAKPFAHAGLRFEQGDQAALTGQWDLIFSNAALHWSENHETLIPKLLQHLKPGGQLAVQVPSNHNHISHQVYREVAAEEPFASALNGFNRQSPVAPIEVYAALLFEAEAQEIVVFEKVYPHILENADAVVDWISGTALVPYFERLDDERRQNSYNDFKNFTEEISQGGGKFLTGGHVKTGGMFDKGYFCEPTLVTDLPFEHRLWKYEMFLPITTIGKVSDLDQAMKIANNVKYGLTAGFYGTEKESQWFFDKIEAGVTYANRPQGATTGAWPGFQPFGGWKGSGASGKNGGGLYYVQLYMHEQVQTLIKHAKAKAKAKKAPVRKPIKKAVVKKAARRR